jgi:hypothetical protein
MKDLIDLGNLVFNQLIKEHSEHEESRMLFLYGVTTGTQWSVLNSDKWLLIEPAGITKNFSDQTIDALTSEWQLLKNSHDQKAVDLKLARMRAEYDRPQPKDGEVIEFWSGSSTFREIKF